MSIAERLAILKTEMTQSLLPRLVDKLMAAIHEGAALHQVEDTLWDLVLEFGRQSLTAFLDCHGDGDQGETVTLADGQVVRRLDALHTRRYVSIFGEFTLQRTVYGSREGQSIAFVPLDNRLRLPSSVFSYLLQDWDQSLAVENAFGQVSKTMQRILRFEQSVDSLEGMNRHMAADVIGFFQVQLAPPPAEEGEILVVTADCKGIVMRGRGTQTVCGGERPGGVRANQKQMAAVGAVYTVDRYSRSADEVVSALFRDADYQPARRPKPCHKRVWATLPLPEPEPFSSIEVVFCWLKGESAPRHTKLPTVYLHDGQEALWQARRDYLPDDNAVDILDLLHVTPRLWAAGKLLYGERSKQVEPWVRQRVTQVLEGKVETVIRGLRRLGRERELSPSKKKSLQGICRYLCNNRQRMRYDEYLRQGFPIASGVIEGACRHLVKDRMERAGMHWTPEGAQAMLDLRSIQSSGCWEEYQKYRIENELERLYPNRDLVAGEAYFATAA